MVEVYDLSAGYLGKTVLRNLNMKIPEGKVTVVVGPNGCGKSTFLKVLCGILPAERGSVLLDGENLLALPQQQRAQRVAYLAQNRQVPDITVGRLVLHGRFPYLGYPRRYRKEDYDWADKAMAQMGIFDLKDTLLQNLSGGQRQKAYIAMVLAQDTPVVLMDEPTTYLDVRHQLRLMKQARIMAEEGKTVLMVLHDLPYAFQCADWMILMHDGAVIAEGTPEELYNCGAMEQTFQIHLGRTITEKGWRYYCEEGDI